MKNTPSTNTKYEIIYYTSMYLESKEIKGEKDELVTQISMPWFGESGFTGHVFRAAVKTVDGVEVDKLEPIGINKRKNDAGEEITIVEESTERLFNAKKYQDDHPNKKVLHEKRVQISEEGFNAVKANHEILRPYFVKPDDEPIPVPLELIGGKELGVFVGNCGHWVNSENKLALLEGSYLYNYTEKDINDAPGWIHKGIGFFENKKQFVSGDKERTELSNLSLEEFAKANNLPLDRIRKKELVKLPEPDGLMLRPEEKNAYVIAPNPKLVASAASEEAQINENFVQLAVTEDEGLQEYMGLFEIIAKTIGSPIKLFHSSKNTKILDCGVGEKGKLIEILFDYNNNAQWTCADEEMWFPKSDPSNFQPFTTKNIYEAIAHSTEGRYTAQDLIELQIAPPPEVASPASEEVLTPISHNDEESMEKLAVALNQKLLVREDQKVKELYGMGCTGKEEDDIMISYDTKQRKYTYQNRMPGSLGVFSSPNMYEAIAIRTNGRYTAQDLLELQRSNFQAITATSQGSMLTSDGDKKPAFNQNSTPSTASNSEQEQQHSVQLRPAPVDPEYEDYLIRSKAMMASFPFLLQQIEERSGLYSYESWKKAHDIGMEIAKTSKVESIIEAALKAFKEKFEAIRDKFTKKLKDDIEKTAKDASDSQQNGQAEYDAKAQAIHQQKAQEIEAMREQLQSTYNSQASEIAQRKKGEIDAFFQQGQAECDAVFAARSGAASNQPSSSSGFALSYVVSNSDVVAQKNAELSTFKAQKIAEMDAEQQGLLAQTQNQLKSFIASKEAEAEQKCNALKSSIEQRLKSTESKIKQIAEAAQTKQEAQVAECNRKIKDIKEDTGLIERLKEVVGNSGDAEGLINEELNVVLQGVASDFGVDAVTL